MVIFLLVSSDEYLAVYICHGPTRNDLSLVVDGAPTVKPVLDMMGHD